MRNTEGTKYNTNQSEELLWLRLYYVRLKNDRLVLYLNLGFI